MKSEPFLVSIHPFIHSTTGLLESSLSVCPCHSFIRPNRKRSPSVSSFLKLRFRLHASCLPLTSLPCPKLSNCILTNPTNPGFCYRYLPTYLPTVNTLRTRRGVGTFTQSFFRHRRGDLLQLCMNLAFSIFFFPLNPWNIIRIESSLHPKSLDSPKLSDSIGWEYPIPRLKSTTHQPAGYR